MRMKRKGFHFVNLVVYAVAVSALLAAAGCGGGGYPSEPTVVAVVSGATSYFNGGTAVLTATVESENAASNVQVDYFLKAAGGKKDCTATDDLPSWHVILPSIAHTEKDAPAVETWTQRFVSTKVEYDPGTKNRRAFVTQNLLVPQNLAAGSYYLVSAVNGKSDCKYSDKQVKIAQPTAPDILHSGTALANNSFKLPKKNTRQGKLRPGAVFMVSSEIANLGLAVNGPVEIGFKIKIGETSYPLLVEVRDGNNLPVNSERYIYSARTPPTAGAFDQGDVRGTTHRLYLSDAAYAALSALTADTDCTIYVTIDPDSKISQMDKNNDVAIKQVKFLATLPGDAGVTCNPDSTHAPDFNDPQYVFCLGPNDPNMSWGGGLISGTYLYAGYQLGGSSTDPTYLAIAKPIAPTPIPAAAAFHTDDWVRIGWTSTDYYSVVDATLDVGYNFPPVPDPAGSGDLILAYFSGHFTILGDSIFDYDKQISIKSEYDFEFFKEEKKWVLYKDTVIVGDVVPVTFKMGVEGEVGLGGKANIKSDASLNAEVDLSIGPSASFSAFGEAQVDLIVCSVGVGVELTVVEVDVSFSPYLQYYAPPADNPKVAYGAIQLGASIPLTIGEGAGDFYLYVKSFGYKWKTTLVSWDGFEQDFNCMTPVSVFIGPIGEFFTQISGGNDGTPQGGVFSDTPPGSTTNPDAITQWIGDIKLNNSKYQFTMLNVNSIKLKPETTATYPSAYTYSGTQGCNDQQHTWTVDLTGDSKAPGTYTLLVNTDNTCFKSGSTAGAFVTWVEIGNSSTSSLTGKAGTVGGTPSCAVAAKYYNGDPGVPGSGSPYLIPDLYQCDTGVSIQNDYGTIISQEPLVNAPKDGVWIVWEGMLPMDLKTLQSMQNNKGAVLLFSGNPPPTGCAPSTVDEVVVSIYGANMQPISNQFPLWVTLGPGGNALVPINDTNSPAMGPPYYFSIYYHSLDTGDMASSCSTANPNDANLNVVTLPNGNWLVVDVCNVSKNLVVQPSLYIPGPKSAAAGTLGGGSLNQFNNCANVSGIAAAELVGGAFNFTNIPAGGQNFDFIAGSTTDQNYRIWIDGQLVAHRIVSDPKDPTQNPSYTCCQKNGWCPTRESHFVYNITPGYHFIEGYFEAEGTLGYPNANSKSENRIRWSPVNPAGNEALVSIYGNQTELNGVLYAPDGGSSGQDGGSAPYNTVESLMIYKDTSATGLKSQLVMDWVSSDDCDSAFAGQIQCGQSLAEVVCNTGNPNGMGFSTLWDGYYNFTDQALYSFNIWSNRNNADLWIDGQQFSQALQSAGQAYNAFPVNTYYGVIANNNQPPDPQDGGYVPTGDGGLNHLRLAMGGAGADGGLSAASFSATWQVLPSTNHYQVQFLDQNAQTLPPQNPMAIPTIFADSMGSGETQTMCFGAGCGNSITAIPSGTCRIVVLASPVGDTNGTYNLAGNPNIDQLTKLTCTGSGVMADLCINGYCVLGNACTGQSINSSQAGFVPYVNNPTDQTQNQGLFSLKVNNMVITLRGGGATPGNGQPYTDCLTSGQLTQFQAVLNYQQHQW